MRTSRFTGERIVGMLREHDRGTATVTETASGRWWSATLGSDGGTTVHPDCHAHPICHIGGVCEKKTVGGVATVTAYSLALGRTVAMRRGSASPMRSLGDQLGGASVVTDGSGVVVPSEKYWPYGGPCKDVHITWSCVMSPAKLYTGSG
ncbi:MAG TPA: hypothetical protein VEZ14_00165 [Dehalococcoidia bacterium]|nr:hypothetical protein [Dehalococcoidia bacterium]